MEEHRSCIGQRVYAVEYSTMTGDAISHVFDAFITFDGRDDYISRKSGNGNEGADQNYVGRGERSEESQKVSYNRSADDTSQKAFPCFVGTHFGQNFVTSEEFSPDELRAYFAEILPNFDRERVYPSDIKKLISWYNILIGAGLTEFTPEGSATEEASVKETKKEEA